MWWAQLLNVIAGIHGTGVAAATNSYESIATVLVGSGGQANIDFTSIASTYKHLQVRWLARNNQSAPDDTLAIQFNGDTASNYALHLLYGDGSSTGAVGLSNRSEILVGYQTSNSASANQFGVGILDILDYANTNKFKTVRNLGGDDRNGGGTVALASGLWRSTSAITSIKFFSGGASFQQHSQFALYGIKG